MPRQHTLRRLRPIEVRVRLYLQLPHVPDYALLDLKHVAGNLLIFRLRIPSLASISPGTLGIAQ